MKLRDHIHQTKMRRSFPPEPVASPPRAEERPLRRSAPGETSQNELSKARASSSDTSQKTSFRLADFIRKKPARPPAPARSATPSVAGGALRAAMWAGNATHPPAALRAAMWAGSVAGGPATQAPDLSGVALAKSEAMDKPAENHALRVVNEPEPVASPPASPIQRGEPKAACPPMPACDRLPACDRAELVPAREESAPARSATPSVAGGPSSGPITEHSSKLADFIRKKFAVRKSAAGGSAVAREKIVPPACPPEILERRQKAGPAAAGEQPKITPASREEISPPLTEKTADEPLVTLADDPVKAETTSPAEDGTSLFEAQPAAIYEVARQLGIALPPSREVMVDKARSALNMIFKKIVDPSASKNMIWPMIKSIATDVEGIVDGELNILDILHRYQVKEEKLARHSLYTAILAMDLARNAQFIDSSVLEIGGAALLHDAGLLLQGNGYDAIDNINLPDLNNLDDHVAKGVKLAREIEVPDVVVTMIAQHHGRLDGQGYPPGLTSKTFLRGSQIVAMANIFEKAILAIALEKKEGLSEEETRKNGIPQTFNDYRKAFSTDLLKKMIALIGLYPVGSIVELNNRVICEVVKQNRDFPVRPVVKVILDGGGNHPEAEQLIDLKQVKILSILRNIARPKNA